MYALDNNSGVAVMPPVKTQLNAPTAPHWFTEGGNGVAPSYPGADWFNIVQAELLNVLSAAGLAPNKAQLNQLSVAITTIVTQNKLSLTGDTGNGSSSLAFSAEGAKRLAQSIAQNQQRIAGLSGSKLDKSALSNAVNSTSTTTAGSSLAVKTAYDKAVEASNKTNGCVSKAGDTMTGTLSFQGANQNYRIGNYTWRKAIHLNGDNAIGNEAVIIAFNNNGILHLGGKPNEQFNAELDKTRLWVLGDVRTGSGKSLNATHQTTYAYVETTISNSDYGGANFKRRGSAGNWDSRVEPLPDKRWKFWVQNSHETYLPAKSGTIALLEDFTYQKIGNFEVRRYPDGTMIQTYFVSFSGQNQYRHERVYSFNWAVAFVDKPMVFGNTRIRDKNFTLIDRFQAEVEPETNGSKYSYYLFDPGGDQGNWDMQFLAIGRWK